MKDTAETIDVAGSFYLGKLKNADGELSQKLLQYPSKDLTTHAICLGMTGSGKTGLGVVILEEAALDSIPAIIVDPKGDLGNLLLAFPKMEPEDFLPWIDEGEASRKGLEPLAYAKEVASTWSSGLESWGEGQARVAKYNNAVERCIYTPASQAGMPLSILDSFKAPPQEILLDTAGAFRERVMTTTTGLLGLLGINADPLKSKEHILIASLLTKRWQEGVDLDLPSLIKEVQQPPFDKIGVLALDDFYPPKERLALSISLNNLLASPGFSNWLIGEPLNIQNLLYTDDGKPKHSIITIAHLNDSERMFFVTLLLNEIIAWTRKQSGTSSLRALLYMDEIYGFFPPIATPPSKQPMLTLLKQARAFGLGIVLATQNPVDIDYKGLSNCGTWFIGKLQTDRDMSRVLEGMKSQANELNDLKEMLSQCKTRTFVVSSVHLPKPQLFETRWTLSYLRGPLTLPQIEKLTHSLDGKPTAPAMRSPEKESTRSQKQKSILPTGIQEFFLDTQKDGSTNAYHPKALGVGKLHFVDSKYKLDVWQERVLVAPFSADGQNIDWDKSDLMPDGKAVLSKDVPLSGEYESLPACAMQEKKYQALGKSLQSFLYQTQAFQLYQAPELKLTSKEGESKEEFLIRATSASQEVHEKELTKIKDDYSVKITSMEDKIAKANAKLLKMQNRSWSQRFEAFLSFIMMLISGAFGRSTINDRSITRAGTTLRRAGKVTKDAQDVSTQEEEISSLEEQLEELQREQEKAILITNTSDIDIQTIEIKPRKTDISVEPLAIFWDSKS